MRVRVAGTLASIVLSGCSFEIPPPSYIHGTEVLMVRHSVAIGSLDPQRVGPTFAGMDDAPIAEILPGDVLRLEAVVVDHEGRRLADDELETLWVQCGDACLDPYVPFDIFVYWPFVPCDDIEDHTVMNHCVLGTGTGAFELEVPPLHEISLLGIRFGDLPVMSFFGVVAWDGRAAEDCWESRRTDQAQLDGCGFIYHDVPIGPLLWTVANAESLGAESPLDDEDGQLPPLVEVQPANRIPLTPALTVRVDDEVVAMGVPPLPTIEIDPGARISIELAFDYFSQALQRKLRQLSKYDAWELVDEQLFSSTATSGAIWRSGSDQPISGAGSFSYEVDPEARPGRSRVLILYADEGRAGDVVSVEFEVR